MRSPRKGDTYRAARRNGSGALPTHSPVLAEYIKLRPVEGRVWLPYAERQRANGAKARTKNALRDQMAKIMGHRPSSRRADNYVNKPGEGYGAVRLSIWSSVKKVRRAIRRGKLVPEPIKETEKKPHAWYQKVLFFNALRARQAFREGRR